MFAVVFMYPYSILFFIKCRDFGGNCQVDRVVINSLAHLTQEWWPSWSNIYPWSFQQLTIPENSHAKSALDSLVIVYNGRKWKSLQSMLTGIAGLVYVFDLNLLTLIFERQAF